MNASVWGKLGMKGRGHDVALADQGRVPLAEGESLDLWPDLHNTRRANKNHLQRSAGERSFARFNTGIDLAAIGIALDDCVEHSQAALRRIADLAGQQDTAGAGSEDRFPCAELAQGLEEMPLIEELEHGCGFAARQDKGVDSAQLFGIANLAGLGSCLGEGEGMGSIIALDSENTNA